MSAPVAAPAPTAIAPTNGASAPQTAPATPPAPNPTPTVPDASGAPAATGTPPGPSVKWKVADLQALIQAAGADATEAEVFSLLKGYKHRVKVDGKETEVPFEEMIRHAGLGKAARQEINRVRDLEAKLSTAQEKLGGLAQRMLDPQQATPVLEANWGGPDGVYQWAKKYVTEHEGYLALPPEERARRDRMTQQQREAASRERQLAEREARIKAEEAKIAKGRRDAWVARMGRECPPAFQSLGLPNEPKLVKEALRLTIGLLDRAAQRRIPMTVAEAQKEAVDSIVGSFRSLVTGLSPDAVRGLVGDAGLQAVQAANLARVENQPGRSVPAPTDQPRGENGQFRKDMRVSRLGKLDDL